MGKLKTIINEADSSQVKWRTYGVIDGFRGTFMGPNGAKFGADLGSTPMDYTSKADNKMLDKLWKDETSFSTFDDYGFTCVCFDFETYGRGSLDSSTITQVSEIYLKILVDKFKANRIQFVYFQSTRPIPKKIHAIIAPKIAPKMGFQIQQIKTGWIIGKDIFKK